MTAPGCLSSSMGDEWTAVPTVVALACATATLTLRASTTTTAGGLEMALLSAPYINAAAA